MVLIILILFLSFLFPFSAFTIFIRLLLFYFSFTVLSSTFGKVPPLLFLCVFLSVSNFFFLAPSPLLQLIHELLFRFFPPDAFFFFVGVSVQPL